MVAGVTVKSYYIDNGIYTSKEFTRYLHGKGQGISHSGLGGHNHNGVEKNVINNVVRISRTMMIHAVMRWNDASERILWTMDMAHYVQLHSLTSHIYSGIYQEEFWTRSKLSHSALHYADKWVYHEYVLETRLKYGKKFTKWISRSRRSQYLGASPLHAIALDPVSNLQTGNTSPQFHLVFDDYFETLHAGEAQ